MADIERLLSHIERSLGGSETWDPVPDGYPNKVEAALIDAVFSANARYGSSSSSGVRAVVGRWREHRGGRLDDLVALTAAVERLGGDGAFAEVLGNRQRVPGPDPLRPTKAAAVFEIARRLSGNGVISAADLLDLHERDPAELRRLVTATSGVGKVTHTYMLMLLQVPGVKADRMIRRFVADALDRDEVDPAEASALVADAASRYRVNPIELDHLIWRYQRRR